MQLHGEFPATVASSTATDSPAPPCKVCGGWAQLLCHTSGGPTPDGRLRHYRCGDCGLVFVGDRLTAEQLDAAYAAVDYVKYYEGIEVTTQRKLRKSLVDLRNYIDHNSRILDVGTGNGHFLQTLIEEGYTNIAGHDLPGTDFTEFEDRCTLYFDRDYHSVPSESFDVVTMLDVAEHVLDPHELLGACFRILKPGGIVYLHTPVVTRTDRLMHLLDKLPKLRAIGQAWQRGRTSVYHLQNYTEDALQRVLRKAGFQDASIRVTNELSWPLHRYVRVFLCARIGLPGWSAKLIAPFFYPLLATDALNSNKAIVLARKPYRHQLPTGDQALRAAEAAA